MKRPIESDYTSLTAYTRAPEEYCEALAQQEPVEWGVDWGKDGNSVSIIKRLADGNIEVLAWEYAPYTPQRTWVGLNDMEIDQGLLRTPYAMKTAEAWREGVRWAYDQLKEKNT